MLFLCEASKIKITVAKDVTSSLQVKFKVACLVRQSLFGPILSTWQMTAASCPTTLGALCQLMFQPVWCHEQ